MGRAINNENKLEDHERRLNLIENLLEELVQTRVHHVDLQDEMDKHEENIRRENSVLQPDEEFTPPAGKRKKVTRKTKTVTT